MTIKSCSSCLKKATTKNIIKLGKTKDENCKRIFWYMCGDCGSTQIIRGKRK